jgi:hypothetical protein
MDSTIIFLKEELGGLARPSWSETRHPSSQLCGGLFLNLDAHLQSQTGEQVQGEEEGLQHHCCCLIAGCTVMEAIKIIIGQEDQYKTV